MPETNVASFIIRITWEEDAERVRDHWTGLVRHIQTGTEERFVDLAQASQFIERLLAVQQDDPPPALPTSRA